MKLLLDITTPKDARCFEIDVRCAKGPEDLWFDEKGFYGKCGTVLEFPHHELEIVRPSKEFLGRFKIHTHPSEKTNTLFVCWPQRLATIEEAKGILRVWCVGTAAVLADLDCGENPLNLIYDRECKGDAHEFLKRMRTRHGVYLSRLAAA